MKLKELINQAGTIEVQAAPLLMLIGAAMAAPHSPDLESIVEMLDPDEERT